MIDDATRQAQEARIAAMDTLYRIAKHNIDSGNPDQFLDFAGMKAVDALAFSETEKQAAMAILNPPPPPSEDET